MKSGETFTLLYSEPSGNGQNIEQSDHCDWRAQHDTELFAGDPSLQGFGHDSNIHVHCLHLDGFTDHQTHEGTL